MAQTSPLPEKGKGTKKPKAPKRDELLSFKPTGRILKQTEIAGEYRLMAELLKTEMTAEKVHDIATQSGTHLLKLITPRAESGQAVLRVEVSTKSSNAPVADLYPSVNAVDIPFAKILFRPLEFEDQSPQSVADAIRNPGLMSEAIIAGFTEVFGDDCIEALKLALEEGPEGIVTVPSAEFPIIFLPRDAQRDIQVTPISPVESYMGFKKMMNPYFDKDKADAPPLPRGKWIRRSVSSKPQNITGKIGGPRARFLATMPPHMAQEDAEIFRFVKGGRFPSFRDDEIDKWILKYADFAEKLQTVRKEAIKDAAQRIAKRLITDALAFTEETLEEAKSVAMDLGMDPEALGEPPAPADLLYNRRWNAADRDRVRKFLSAAQFNSIQYDILKNRKRK